MSDTWALRDIGRAKSKVRLGYLKYDQTKIKHNYQEAWISGNVETQQKGDLHRMFPADHWASAFDASSKNIEDFPQIGGLVLITNKNPDAPLQTLVRGFVGTDSTLIPDIRAASSEYVPSFIETEDGSNIIPSSSGTTSSGGDVFPNFSPSVGDAADIQETLIDTTPFIPSSIDMLADDATEYKDRIEKNGIKLHNFWEMGYPSPSDDQRRYLKNYGPQWGSAAYSGAVCAQVGTIGNLRVKVAANRSSALMYRVAPLQKDIGRDTAYPWIFPKVDDRNNVSHAYDSSVVLEDSNFQTEYWVNTSGDGANESSFDGEKNIPNIGFIMDLTISNLNPRGSFFGSGGGGPNIVIKWGGANSGSYEASSDSGFASSFSIHISPNSVPYLRYHDGDRYVKATLLNNALSGMGSTSKKISVQYFGTMLSVTFLDGSNEKTTILKAYTEGIKGFQSSIKGVWVENNNVQLWVQNCTATFSCMPAYYNPWDPSQTEDIEKFESGEYTSYGIGPTEGFVKLTGVANFTVHGNNASNILALVSDVESSFNAQTIHPEQIKYGALGNFVKSGNGYCPDAGWPQCVLDTRHKNDGDTHPVRLIGYKSVLGTGLPETGIEGEPFLSQTDPSSSVSMVWQICNIYSTPIIYGFKAKGEEYDTFTNTSQDVSDYVNEWTINWSEETDHKVMRASASVTFLNPPQWLIDSIAQNIMTIEIGDVGYPSYASQVNDNVKQFVYKSGPIFFGLTNGGSLSFGSGGDVLYKVDCEDPIHLLDVALFETNMKFDGTSYYAALCHCIRHTEYWNYFTVNGYKNLRLSPTWINDGLPSTPSDWTEHGRNTSSYGNMYFGFLPLSGMAYEINSGSSVWQNIEAIINNMHNPRKIPLFYFKPSINSGLKGNFNFVVRDIDNVDPQALNARVIVQSEINNNEDFKSALPLLAAGGNKAWDEKAENDFKSHATMVGADRATGTPVKATAVNPQWNSMNGGPIEWGKHMGHLGFKSRLFDTIPVFIPDIHSARGLAISRMWWHQRPWVSIDGLSVHGIIDPNNDGLLKVRLGSTEYEDALLTSSTIRYSEDEGTLISSFGVFVYPKKKQSNI